MAECQSRRPARQAAERARLFFQQGFRFPDDMDQMSISSDEEDIFLEEDGDGESETESDQASDSDSSDCQQDGPAPDNADGRAATDGGGDGSRR